MDWIQQALAAVATGLFLRFALPILVTAGLVLWLRWLDARWQRDAHRYVDQSGGLRLDVLPCWKIMGCSRADRKNCAAYQDPNTPCWQVFRDSQGHLKETCLGCEVFRRSAVPVSA